MPLPLILGAVAAVAAAGGIGAGVSGGVKMKKAGDKAKEAQKRHEQNVRKMNNTQAACTATMDILGKREMAILASFQEFQDTLERIHNRPSFSHIQRESISIPKYNPEEVKKASVGAAVLAGGLGGAAAGTAGGFAAAGATYAAVMALGTASTGTAIASLTGVAATNATLAALGGGAIAAGGGGMALGSAVLGGATLGIGLLIGGVIFNFAGGKLSEKSEKAWEQMLENEKQINKVVAYLQSLRNTATSYLITMKKVEAVYRQLLHTLQEITEHKTNWNQFTDEEKLVTENLVLSVGVLYSMCKVKLVLQSKSKDTMNTINHEEIRSAQRNAGEFLEEVA